MRVKRDAFLYLEPKPRDGGKDFAQCISCRLYVPKVHGLKGPRCVIHGSKKEIGPDWTCGLYVDWPKGKPDNIVVATHARELANGIPGSVTPEESGMLDRRVQCDRCGFSAQAGTICVLYERLNKVAPDEFDLDSAIKPHACCNAWVP